MSLGAGLWGSWRGIGWEPGSPMVHVVLPWRSGPPLLQSDLGEAMQGSASRLNARDIAHVNRVWHTRAEFLETKVPHRGDGRPPVVAAAISTAYEQMRPTVLVKNARRGALHSVRYRICIPCRIRRRGYLSNRIEA